jgi:hypothetical protein
MRGLHPNSRAALDQFRADSIATRTNRAAEGIAYARAWRIRNKPVFDAMYGAS